jgi:pimeloyl-ACP methyl ester carboxylesterase
MARLAFGRSGAGAPLVLLHALGLSRHTWDPVVPALAELFDVIAVDLPGFGGSEPLPDGVEPSPARHPPGDAARRRPRAHDRQPRAVTALILHSTAREGGGCDSRCLWG